MQRFNRPWGIAGLLDEGEKEVRAGKKYAFNIKDAEEIQQCGRYWTRTSDLPDVNGTLSTN
jgi:hypothetical protein